ncbi:hypothetical protein [Facklamia sp. 7083-14-GEN3]|uniref:hypothetical protein n=1 Tax=Facklamia sp. 7083-14-GEN3 TaxID=2973478 RepID=UPI00215BEA5B|nr:hypothetical protein [Facklamia sp. 7083-14-GEN3]MCR8969728.1 hypothetical protein [Facklamia sp. 7083-14-GEN3]
MANLIETVNELEALSAEKVADYQKKLQEMQENFEDQKITFKRQVDSEFAQFKQTTKERFDHQFLEVENDLRNKNQLSVVQIEADIANRREDLTQKIAEKVVKEIWQ